MKSAREAKFQADAKILKNEIASLQKVPTSQERQKRAQKIKKKLNDLHQERNQLEKYLRMERCPPSKEKQILGGCDKQIRELNLKMNEVQISLLKQLIGTREGRGNLKVDIEVMTMEHTIKEKIVKIRREQQAIKQGLQRSALQTVEVGNTLQNMNSKATELHDDLGLLGELTSIINNRNLYSRLILILLALFLALADIIALFLKFT